MKHRIKFKKGLFKGGRSVTWAKCKCGWKSEKFLTSWEFCETYLDCEVWQHLVNVKIIKKGIWGD